MPDAGRADPTTTRGSRPCDWELRVDLADGAPVVVRAAVGRPCCVHVLSLRSLDAAPVATDREERSWSGERTRIGPSRAVSDVRVDRRQVHPKVRGLDLSLEAALTRAVHSPVITIAEDAAGDRLIPPTAEELWTTHLARLRDAAVISEADEVPSRLQTATMHRTEVAVQTTRQCATPGHRLDARARVSVRVDGEATPVTGSRLGLPSVAGWIEGDLQAAAIDPIDVAADTDVHPAPGTGAVSGLTLDTAPGSGLLRGRFAGHAATHVLDGGIRLVAAGAVVADLGLGGGSTHAAEGRLAVHVAHDVHVVVSPHVERALGDDPGGAHLGCACTPEYEVQFGGPPQAGDHSAPHARLHVDGRVFRLDAVAAPRAGAMPSWTVGPDAGEADTRQGSTA